MSEWQPIETAPKSIAILAGWFADFPRIQRPEHTEKLSWSMGAWRRHPRDKEAWSPTHWRPQSSRAALKQS